MLASCVGRLELAVRLGDLLGRTSDGMRLWYDTSKNTVATPMTSATTIEVPHLQGVRPPQQRHGAERDRAHGVRPDHDVPLAHPVDPRAGGQPDHEERRDAGGVEDADLELGRVQDAAPRAPGIASSVICAPNWLKACPLQSVRKLRSRQREPFAAGSAGAVGARASPDRPRSASSTLARDAGRAMTRPAPRRATLGIRRRLIGTCQSVCVDRLRIVNQSARVGA